MTIRIIVINYFLIKGAGLSDRNCAEHYLKCNQAHTTSCSHCMNIIPRLDEINRK